jgi:molybdopterin molybdotransferase
LFEDKIDWDTLSEIIQKHIKPISRKVIHPLHEIRGYIAAETINSEIPLPPFSRSLVDGYAISAASEQWKVVGERILPASEKIILGDNEAYYVPTGGVLPQNTWKVLKVENCVLEGNMVKLEPHIDLETIKSEIEKKGVDIPQGTTLIKNGDIIGVREITILASVGIPSVWVYDKPKYSIIITGNEIYPQGSKLMKGAVYDSTSPMIQTYLSELGAKIVDKIYVNEDYQSIRNAISLSLPTVDFIITTGGTSMGKQDNVYKVIKDHGDTIFHGMNVRPGKPMLLGKIDYVPILAFPGFVTSSIIMADIILPEFVEMLSRKKSPVRKIKQITVGEDVKGFPGWFRLLTGKIVEDMFYPVFKTSSAVSSFTNAEGYIIIKPTENIIRKGDQRDFYYFVFH